MGQMFYNCSSLANLDLSHFSTENVTSMSRMFGGCTGLKTLNVSSFNTSNVTDMKEMFRDCSSLKSLNLSNFDTSKTTVMNTTSGGMFQGCLSLESLDISSFDTSKLTSMAGMFNSCSSLTSLDVSNFDTRNATSFERMFVGCSSLKSLDVNNFVTTKVTNFISMFGDCTGLERIYCNNSWYVQSNKISSNWMFDDCTNLKGDAGNSYDSSKSNLQYAQPDNGGYFTKSKITFSTVTFGGTPQYWRTFYTDTRNVKADEQTTVYIATLNAMGTELILHEVTDKIIPAGQAVVLRCSANTALIDNAEDETSGDFSKNSLKGTQRKMDTSKVSGAIYTMAVENGSLGFYRFTGNSLAAGKAYLNVPSSGSREFRVVIASDATNISSVNREDAAADRCYDLQGRYVNQPKKGLYIVNGKKVVF